MSAHTDTADALDVVVIGGGQAALSVAYFLRRTSWSYVLLDAEDAPGGAWRHGWPSLRLFSPAQVSSLSGWPMPPVGAGFPTRDHVIDYLARYEERYQIPVLRPVWVNAVERGRGRLLVRSAGRSWSARAVVSATGTWRAPFVPAYPGGEAFAGTQLHSADYAGPEPFAGRRVLVVGGGNSGAQNLAEVSAVAETVWVTERAPRFLPDGVDGGLLFRWTSERWKAQQEGRTASVPDGGLGDIVMVPPVVEARSRGVLVAREPFDHFTTSSARWADGTTADVDAVIWCTGFRPALASRAVGRRRRWSCARERNPSGRGRTLVARRVWRVDGLCLCHPYRRRTDGAQHRRGNRQLLVVGGGAASRRIVGDDQSGTKAAERFP